MSVNESYIIPTVLFSNAELQLNVITYQINGGRGGMYKIYRSEWLSIVLK